MENKSRVILFDELRGVSILSMLLYHLCYDLAVLFGVGGMLPFGNCASAASLSLWREPAAPIPKTICGADCGCLYWACSLRW